MTFDTIKPHIQSPLSASMHPEENIQAYLAGNKLYGDDFDAARIARWFADEAEGYANLAAPAPDVYQYYYHALNQRYGYRFIQNQSFKHVLGMGSAYGDELLPIKEQIERITIVDPSDTFSLTDKFSDVPFNYVKPSIEGDMQFSDNTFDLITCFGVLHHIPNVSHVINECYRCLEPGGAMLLREPIVSMGDWRQPRTGLTKHERGIPPKLLHSMIKDAGFSVQNRQLCMFAPIALLSAKAGISPYNNAVVTTLDAWASKTMSWNQRYHRTSFFSKLAPSSAFYVLQK